jgi:putative hemolysin
VGEIKDEFDLEEEPFERVSDSVIRVQGDVLLDEINQHYALNLSHPDADTVGGLVMVLLGRMPVTNDQLEILGTTIIVESLDGLVPGSVLITLPEQRAEN